MGTRPWRRPRGAAAAEAATSGLSAPALRTLVCGAALALVTLGTGCGSSGTAATAGQASAKQITDLFNAGLAAHNQGNVSLAVSDYQRVLAIDPRNKFALYDLGLIQQESGQATQAETLYRQALNIDPNYSVALFNLAILRTASGPQEAVDLYRHAITLNPKDASSHLNLGFLLVSLGQRDEGGAELRLATGLDPRLASRVPPGLIETSTPSPAPKK
jgi:Flp pilus assembly protein TadD